MHLCDWKDYEKLKKEIIKGVDSNLEVIEPFPILGLTDNLKILKKVSEIYSKKKFFNSRQIKFKLNHDKLKIGYFSSDFHNHPVSHLIKDVFKYHDKSKFELHGFYFGPPINKNDLIQKRILNCFDNFVDINLNDSKLVIENIDTINKEINLNLIVINVPKTFSITAQRVIKPKSE